MSCILVFCRIISVSFMLMFTKSNVVIGIKNWKPRSEEKTQKYLVINHVIRPPYFDSNDMISIYGYDVIVGND